MNATSPIDSSMKSCKSCRYWLATRSFVNETIGECRRRPPHTILPVNPGDPAFGVWPSILSDNWCGEYKRDAAK